MTIVNIPIGAKESGLVIKNTSETPIMLMPNNIVLQPGECYPKVDDIQVEMKVEEK